MTEHHAAGATPMRWIIAVFVLTVLATATAGVGLAIWDGRIGHQDPATRTIHYDTKYDLSSQRRMPPADSLR
jgi:hypothetical protein